VHSYSESKFIATRWLFWRHGGLLTNEARRWKSRHLISTVLTQTGRSRLNPGPQQMKIVMSSFEPSYTSSVIVHSTSQNALRINNYSQFDVEHSKCKSCYTQYTTATKGIRNLPPPGPPKQTAEHQRTFRPSQLTSTSQRPSICLASLEAPETIQTRNERFAGLEPAPEACG
jgi:hypothetical protein